MNRKPTCKRRGSMLIEVLIAVGIGSVLSAVAVAMIVRLYRVEKTISKTMQTSGSERRMADEFRQDAHAANIAKLIQNEDAATMELQFRVAQLESVVWKFENNRLTRTVQKNDESIRSDRFRLPEGTLVSFAVDESPSSPFATLTVRTPSGLVNQGTSTENPKRREYKILAAIGRDRRFEPSNTAEEETP